MFQDFFLKCIKQNILSMGLPFDIFLSSGYVTLAFSTLVTFSDSYLSHMQLWDRKKQHDWRAELGTAVRDQALFWHITNLRSKRWIPEVKRITEVQFPFPTLTHFAIIKHSVLLLWMLLQTQTESLFCHRAFNHFCPCILPVCFCT